MAQLVRAPPCHGGGREFESHLGRFSLFWGLSSAGRASALQAEGHRFESYRPHNIIYAAVAELADARDLKSNGWIVKLWQIFLEKSRILKFHI